MVADDAKSTVDMMHYLAHELCGIVGQRGAAVWALHVALVAIVRAVDVC